MPYPIIHTLDLNFQGVPGTIAAYLFPHDHGAALIECGPGSTVPALVSGLKKFGYEPSDITDLLLTHIHLDHAGAAGWMARQGARIYVHPNGAPHLVNPEKLLSSASRIYGDLMGPLWGEFLPVPEDSLTITQDGNEINIGNLCFRVMDTPGHANHHNAYFLEDICFTGDVGGIRMTGTRHVRLPMPPPDLNLEKWRESLERIRKEKPARIAPIHFGIYDDADWHITETLRAVDLTEKWLEQEMPQNPPIEQLRQDYENWVRDLSREAGLSQADAGAYETTNPSYISADGLLRYWKKYRLPESKL